MRVIDAVRAAAASVESPPLSIVFDRAWSFGDGHSPRKRAFSSCAATTTPPPWAAFDRRWR
jgi:hypothetical protein